MPPFRLNCGNVEAGNVTASMGLLNFDRVREGVLFPQSKLALVASR
jgi:hypothetical protein